MTATNGLHSKNKNNNIIIQSLTFIIPYSNWGRSRYIQIGTMGQGRHRVTQIPKGSWQQSKNYNNS